MFKSMDNWKLLGLEQLASVFKSTTLAINVIDRRISVQQGFDDSRIEENYQSGIFG